MRKLLLIALVGVAGAGGWYYLKKHPARPSAKAPSGQLTRRYVPVSTGSSYQGKTAEEWGQVLARADRETAVSACRALRILGAEGRPYLLQALENPSSETRRLSLEYLSVSDVRCFGERGRQLLLHLAGDRADMRIRDRANHYLAQWSRAIPSPP